MVYKIKISPESLSSIVKEITYSGNTFGVYTGMTSLLNSGVNGASSLTGLTIPILLTQDCIDTGYYSEFDGAIQQKETVLNYVFSAENKYEYCIYNTSILSSYSKGSDYQIYWGDNSKVEPMGDIKSCHVYPKTNAKYGITLIQKNNFGTNIISKTITIPFDKDKVSDNPNGTVEFIPSGGPWKDTPISYDYIFTGDTGMDIDDYIYDGEVTITGYTTSRLNELRLYGPTPFIPGVPVVSKGQLVGVVNNLGPSYTGYTYQNTDYFDFPNGITLSIENSSGLTENNIKAIPLIKEENLIGMVNAAEVQSDVFIDRGKLSGSEGLLRLGEVDNLGDLIKYGYGYFKIKEQ
jgi:hypothetical protein